MSVTVVQSSFAGGEVSPALYGRPDLERYSISCRKLRNFLIKPQGPASSRPGLELVASVKDSTKKVRMIPFRFNIDQIYEIEFGDGYCRFYMDGAQIMNGGVPVEISSPYLEADLSYIHCTQSNDMLFIACKSRAPRTLTRTSHVNWFFALYEFKYGPFMNLNPTDITITPSSTSGDITLTASAAVFNSGHVGSWWQIGQSLNAVYGTIKITEVSSGTVASATVMTTLSDVIPTTIWSEGSWSDYRGYPSSVIFYQDRLIWGCTLWEPQTWWASKTGDYINFARSYPLTDTDGITNPLMAREVSEIRHMISLQDMLFLTSDSVWTVGPVSSGGAFTPTTVKQACHEYRGSAYAPPVVVGNRVIFVQTMGSVVRDVGYNFEADAYTGEDLTLLSRHLFDGHRIVQMAYQQEPDSTIWAVRDDGILLSLTYLREQKMLAWAWHDTDGLFEDVSICGTERNEIWVVIKRGNQRFIERFTPGISSEDPADAFCVDCGLKYDNPLIIENITLENPVTVEITGHGFVDGDLVDITNITWKANQDEYGNVSQPDQLNGWRFIVAFATTDTFILKDEQGDNVDGTGWQAYISGGYVRKAVTAILGLDHLEGRNVAVLANGFVIPNMTVSGGQITLENPASRVVIGLPYICDIETMDAVFPVQSGSMQNRKVKITEVVFNFFRSRGGWYGPDQNHLDEIVQRSIEPAGVPISLISGESKHTMDSGFEDGGRVFFRQKDPLPVTILNIMADVVVGD